MASSSIESGTHHSVLLTEALDALRIKPDGIYVDGTFGRGGHSRKILEKLSPRGQLWVFDKDLQAIQSAQLLAAQDARVRVIHDSFERLSDYLVPSGFSGVDGILCDLGVSSPQLDQADRGFSFSKDGPLDMRMDQSQGPTAAEWLAQVSETELAEVLWRFGEERFSKRIAKQIITVRVHTPIHTTGQLAKIILDAMPFKDPHKHPATRSFQAIRIALNRELEGLENFLKTVPNCLNPGGVLAIISFQSLEDRCVKQTFRTWVQGEVDTRPRDLPIAYQKPETFFSWGIKRVGASEDEQRVNPRSRSALLRSVVKCDNSIAKDDDENSR